MPQNYQVRFATNRQHKRICSSSPSKQQFAQAVRLREHSRLGCRECKKAHLKCDQTFPVCRRCQKRDLICEAPGPVSKRWAPEMPWVFSRNFSSLPPLRELSSRRLEHYFERTSRILVLDVENNPMSYPLLRLLPHSGALIYALQCLSTGHEHYFSNNSLRECLIERSLALQQLREELGTNGPINPATAMAVYVLGISTPWIDQSLEDGSCDHLWGLSALLHTALSENNSPNEYISFLTGGYLYWRMTSSFMLSTKDERSFDDSRILESAQVVQQQGLWHPIVGRCAGIFFHLATVVRYCKRLVDFGDAAKNIMQELDMEELLLRWQGEASDSQSEDYVIGNAHRQAGLIVLYSVSGLVPKQKLWSESIGSLDEYLSALAIVVVRSLTSFAATSWSVGLQGLPIAIAGAELSPQHGVERIQVIKRLEALYSITRLSRYLSIVSILQELWQTQDSGRRTSLLELMKQRSQVFPFG